MPRPLVYHLSNGQRKALMVRSTVIRVALPMPPIPVLDLTEWAVSVLTDDLADYVESAGRGSVWVEAIKPDASSADSLTAHLGKILVDTRDDLAVCCEVVIVKLSPPTGERHNDKSVSWPYYAYFHGERIPRARSADG